MQYEWGFFSRKAETPKKKNKKPSVSAWSSEDFIAAKLAQLFDEGVLGIPVLAALIEKCREAGKLKRKDYDRLHYKLARAKQSLARADVSLISQSPPTSIEGTRIEPIAQSYNHRDSKSPRTAPQKPVIQDAAPAPASAARPQPSGQNTTPTPADEKKPTPGKETQDAKPVPDVQQSTTVDVHSPSSQSSATVIHNNYSVNFIVEPIKQFPTTNPWANNGGNGVAPSVPTSPYMSQMEFEQLRLKVEMEKLKYLLDQKSWQDKSPEHLFGYPEYGIERLPLDPFRPCSEELPLVNSFDRPFDLGPTRTPKVRMIDGPERYRYPTYTNIGDSRNMYHDDDNYVSHHVLGYPRNEANPFRGYDSRPDIEFGFPPWPYW